MRQEIKHHFPLLLRYAPSDAVPGIIVASVTGPRVLNVSLIAWRTFLTS